jgi:phytanoyl-CoA hydroxylase
MERLNKLKQDLGDKGFRYTTGNGCLTLEQRRFYEDNGYLIIRKFLKDADIEKWRNRFIEYCNKSVPP